MNFNERFSKEDTIADFFPLVWFIARKVWEKKNMELVRRGKIGGRTYEGKKENIFHPWRYYLPSYGNHKKENGKRLLLENGFPNQKFF